MTDAMQALVRARNAWQRTQQQLDFDWLDETHDPGGVRLVEPVEGSGASPTPALAASGESSPPSPGFLAPVEHDDSPRRVPGPRHIHSVDRLLEVLA